MFNHEMKTKPQFHENWLKKTTIDVLWLILNNSQKEINVISTGYFGTGCHDGPVIQ